MIGGLKEIESKVVTGNILYILIKKQKFKRTYILYIHAVLTVWITPFFNTAKCRMQTPNIWLPCENAAMESDQTELGV